MPMNILVVGGNSALAQALVPCLASFATVITAGRSSCDWKLDLTSSAEEWDIPKDIDVVINTAAHFGGEDFRDCFDSINVNVLGSLKLAHACKVSKVKHFLHISSTSAMLDTNSAYYGFYSLSKAHADLAIDLYCKKNSLDLTILRPSQLYGSDKRFNRHQPFLYHALENAIKGNDIVIYGNHDPLRNYLHVDDFLKIIVAVIRGEVTGTFQCTTKENVSLANVAASLLSIVGRGGDVVFDSRKENIPDNAFAFDETIYSRIGASPSINIYDGLKMLVEHRLSDL